MGKLIYLTIFLTSLDPVYQNGSDYARRAFLETRMAKYEMKQLEDDSERVLKNYTGLKRDDLAYGAYVYPVIAGKISTKPFQNFKLESSNHWVLRPEIEYQFSNQASTTVLVLIKEF